MRLEIWRRINEAPAFAISDHGRVKFLLTGEIMEPYIDEDLGYLGMFLLDEMGQQYFAEIDVMVVEAFLGGVEDAVGIIHLDGDIWNNQVWNLLIDEDLIDACMNCE